MDEDRTDLTALSARADPERREERIRRILTDARPELEWRARPGTVLVLSGWLRPAAPAAAVAAAAALAALLLVGRAPKGDGDGLAGVLLPPEAAAALGAEEAGGWLRPSSPGEAVP